MAATLPYGPRISGAEYDRRVTDLWDAEPEDHPDRERAALDAWIDHRLGVDFPADRRRAVWRARQSLDRHRLRALVTGLLPLPRHLTAHTAAGPLARATVRALSDVLSDDELRAFLGEASATRPALPVDSR